MKKHLLFLSTMAVITGCTSTALFAQNSSPYWSLAGNSNATTSSKLGTTNSMPLRFLTNNSVRMYIHPTNGNVSIGNGTAVNNSYRLYVKGGTSGIYGLGTSTYGVYGQGGSHGIHGVGGTHGVYGTGTSYGVYGYSAHGYGAQFTSDSSDALDAYTTAGYWGIYAYAQAYTGIYGYGGTYGIYGSSSYIGSYGYSSGTYGLYGFGNYGLYAETRNNNSYYAGYFVGDVYCTTGIYAGSDQKLKQNIRDVPAAMNIINQLHPKLYEFRHDGNYQAMKLPQGDHYGLIAQDLEKVLPNLVKNSEFEVRPDANEPISKENAKERAASSKSEIIDFKAVNYSELIPIMIKALQEQDALIQQQNDKIAELSEKIEALRGGSKATGSTHNYLLQSVPNPANSNVRIQYRNLPERSDAVIILFDNSGRVVKEVQLGSDINGSVDIDISALRAGMYTYTLLLNGKAAETKKMEIAR